MMLKKTTGYYLYDSLLQGTVAPWGENERGAFASNSAP